MYTTNKVGPYPIIDLDTDVELWDAGWNSTYNSIDHDPWNINAQFFNSVVADDHAEMLMRQQDASVDLAVSKAISFAVAVNGTAVKDSPMRYSGHASLSVGTSATAYITGYAWIGRLDGASIDLNRAATVNPVSNPRILASDLTPGTSVGVDWSGTVLNVDRDDDGFGTNPICLGVTIVNPDASVRAIRSLAVSLSLHRDIGIIKTHESER